jgi:hypothetical protein
MALVDDIKQRMFLAMKAKNEIEKEILRVLLGELQMAEARSGKPTADRDAVAVARKLVKSNEETLNVAEDAAQKATLEAELAVLRSFLPSTLGPDENVEALAPVSDAIRAAGNDGQATGVAMKHLKAAGAPVDGRDVADVVKKLRA